ncbi:portal protein [Mammaliicoccus virus vB_MscM-PMS2]|nr:portal protein [Mammaliicoccus virus vB_MscM-PMS2]
MGLFDDLIMMGVKPKEQSQSPYGQDIQELNKNIKSYEDWFVQEKTKKGMGVDDKTKKEPIIGMIGSSPDYRDKNSYTRNMKNLQDVLKRFGNNIIINAIINVRSDQVAMYCQPTRYSKRGMGFEVRLKDLSKEPGANEKKEIERIEEFILNTSQEYDIERDTFYDFCKKIVRDTLIYDQVNFEKNLDKNGKLKSFTAVDPTTIFHKTKEHKLVRNSDKLPRYVQVIDNQIVNEYTNREMVMGIRRPRTDINASGYGLSELEIALKQIIAHENTEAFNDRFFSHGGTTRGVLLIKHEQQQSQYALENFKREWKSSLSGINGSWQIPVVSADDVKFVNMTPTANDMQFEKWLNYLINVISSVYGIDPSELNFPNRGGATGSKSNSLNEGDSSKKNRDSQNKGLQPLLKFIEVLINKHIVAEFGNKYIFEFSGGDSTSEKEKLEILKLQSEIFKTPNQIAVEQGYEGNLPGGDTIMVGEAIQRQGQNMQQEQFEYQKQQDRNAKLNPEQDTEQPKGDNGVGKDGQLKDQENTNSGKQGMTGDKPNDWEKESKKSISIDNINDWT